MIEQPIIPFNDGNAIPQMGLGAWQAEGEVAVASIKQALQVGYRHIDTASFYCNEKEVGEGIRLSSVARSDIFLTTKLWNDDQGYDSTLKAFEASQKRLGLDYVDLYLVHWPAPQLNKYVETWKALIALRNEGRIRSIGVSNFCQEHILRLIEETGICPVINQIELHPRFQQREMRDFHAQHGIITQSWSPLGQGTSLNEPIIEKIARKHMRSPAQIIIRWHLDQELSVIPKSTHPDRIRENFSVFDFKLDDEDMALIASLDSADTRIGPDPRTADF